MKKIGIGYENYKEFIDQDMYYIDKTLLIRDIMEKGGKVTLFIRPRRFGKTLAFSMLRTFFEKEYDYDGNLVEKRRYFEGKKIMEADGKILSMMGRYPVIKLFLKSAKQPDYWTAALRLYPLWDLFLQENMHRRETAGKSLGNTGFISICKRVPLCVVLCRLWQKRKKCGKGLVV